MKKYIRILAVIALMGIMLSCISGCRPVIKDDTNPNDFVVISRDKETLTYNGHTYYKMPKDANLFCIQKTSNRVDQILNVNHEGVAKIITNVFYDVAEYNEAHDFLKVECWHINKFIFDSQAYEPPTEFYCNKTTYDAYLLSQEINTPMERIGFEYYKSQEDSQEYSFQLGILSAHTSNEILCYINNPKALTKETFEGINTEMLRSVAHGMYECDAQGTLARRFTEFDIYKNYRAESFLVNTTEKTAVKLSLDTTAEVKYKYLK